MREQHAHGRTLFFFSAQHSVNMSDRPRCRAIYDPSSCFICMGSYSHSERNFHPYSVCCSFCLRPLHTQKKKEKRKERALMDGSFIKIRAGRWMTIECECFITNGNGGLVLHVTSTKYPPSRQRRKENLSISNQSR